MSCVRCEPVEVASTSGYCNSWLCSQLVQPSLTRTQCHSQHNPRLRDIDGLRNLRHVAKFIFVAFNAKLSRLAPAFSNVRGAFEGNIRLLVRSLWTLGSLRDILKQNNKALSSLSGLEHITSLSGFLHIAQNGKVQTLYGLARLVHVSANLYVEKEVRLRVLV